MTAPFDASKWITVALSAVALLLCGLLYWEWEEGRRLEQGISQLRRVPVSPVSVQTVLPEFVLPDIEAGFPELVARSLFTVSRRSASVAAKGGQSAMKKGQFVLVGVMVTPSQRSALLRDVQTNRTEAVAAGSLIRGMTLENVEPGKVVLRQGGGSEELILNVQSGSKVAHPGVSLPATAGPANTPATMASAPAKTPAAIASAPTLGASAPPPGFAPKTIEVASSPKGSNAPPPTPPVSPQK